MTEWTRKQQAVYFGLAIVGLAILGVAVYLAFMSSSELATRESKADQLLTTVAEVQETGAVSGAEERPSVVVASAPIKAQLAPEEPRFPKTQAATAELCSAEGADRLSCEPRDASGFTMFQSQIGGAQFDERLPTAEELMETGLRGLGASPTHIAILGRANDGSVRCEWHGTVLTNAQRENTIRVLLGIPPGTPKCTLLRTFRWEVSL